MNEASEVHTEGPWVPNVFTSFIRTKDGRAVACIYGDRDDCMSDPCSIARTKLIAASPDLLAALVMVRDADEDCRKDGLPTIPTGPRAVIDAAIAKATGDA